MLSSTSSATAIAAASSHGVPPKYRPVGVALAVGSGVLIGSSFVFKKKGLLSSQKGQIAGQGVAYLKSPLWWTGMTIMILGEICNLVAYSFLEAIVVTPMGALSVVICAMLSHIFLQEKLSLFGWIASFQCILGATILALNGPEEQSVTTIAGFKKLFLAPGFLSYGSVIIVAAFVLALVVAPRWGKKSMLPYLGICSLIGGLSVSCTQGLGACILTSIRGQNQFENWFIYFLLAFVIVTLLTEVYYLNVALAMFNTAMVTPTYYVMFTFCTLVTSVILYQGLKASATQIMTVVLGFFVICTGIFILQMSKVDPRELIDIDRRTSILLKAARVEIDPKAARDLERDGTISRRSRRRTGTGTYSQPPSQIRQHPTVNGADLEALADAPLSAHRDNHADADTDADDMDPAEHVKAVVEKTEDPGIDSLRGTFGALGTIIRARRRATVLSQTRGSTSARSRTSSTGVADDDIRARSRSPRSVVAGGTIKEDEANGGGDADGDVEKVALRRDTLATTRAAALFANGDGRVLVASPLSTPGSGEVRRTSSVHFVGSESAPVILQHTEAESTDPATQAGPQAEEAATLRAQTLPTTLNPSPPEQAAKMEPLGEHLQS